MPKMTRKGKKLPLLEIVEVFKSNPEGDTYAEKSAAH